MLLYNCLTENIVLIYFYLTVYNISSIFIIWTLQTLGYSNNVSLFVLSSLKSLPSVSFIFTATLFSMAGVPPFIGFFTKLFIFLTFLNNSFLILIFYFTPILLISLYFYTQNIRFIYTLTLGKNLTPIVFNTQRYVNIYYTYFTILNFIFIILSTFFLFDNLLYFWWLI
jgi:NADH-quinone oxidoreductase subunit N